MINYFSGAMTLDEIEELDLDNELWEEFCCDVDYYLVQIDTEYRYIVEKNAIYIPALNIDVHYALAESLNLDDEEWELSHDLFIFNISGTTDYVYSENSSLSVCVYNYCNYTKQNLKYITETPCYLVKK